MSEEQSPQILDLDQTMDGTIGTEVLEVGENFISGRLPVSNAVRQPYGIVHGGAIAALAESLTSMATARVVMEQGKIAMGQELNVSFMRPIAKGHVNAYCRVRRRGRTAWNWEVEVNDDDGRLCALLRSTIAVRDAPAQPFPAAGR